MNIRIAQSQDAEKLTGLFNQLGYVSVSSEIATRIVTRTDTASSIMFVAEEGSTIVGMIALHINFPFHESGKWGVISAFVVSDSARSKGIGAMLLRHAEFHAKSAGCTQIELSSSEARIRAHEFYEKNGYSEKRKRFVKLYVN
ncbi:GNAT family N-acetyltransferase [Undibacterium sp. Jales W-56]|uniref:GNAT family N-acetyltransferase n=1 Tax=Undibacterium sp. Jales W-56 TaxID=2897325 RepID=UPI0021CF544B|nr:GNAT family N-acetyltransferase [Undibacterium sp. Jales W-56]MCU6434843.1 GNAT family N-acetyltransferase [Undibacterium sp. Jales W-56]